jgi:cytoskeletal protein CcmA (bactofilin family)
MKRVFTAFAIVTLAALLLPMPVMAGGFYEGKVILGSNFVLDSGETLDGDLLVFGGNVTLKPDSHVLGDVILFGGNVTSDGEVTGGIVVLGGNVNLNAQAVVNGNVFLLGGNLNRDEGARIEGQVMTEQAFDVPYDFQWEGPDFTWFRFSPASTAMRALWFLFRSFMLAALAVLVVMFWPESVKRVAKVTVEQPLLTAGVGVLTAIVTPIVLLLISILIITIPIVLIIALAVVVAVIFGWLSIGYEVGKRMGEVFKWDLHPAAAAGLGTFLFSVVVGGIGFIPCFGWLAPIIMSFLAVGAVILTRFGSQTYTLKPAIAMVPSVEGDESHELQEKDET